MSRTKATGAIAAAPSFAAAAAAAAADQPAAAAHPIFAAIANHAVALSAIAKFPSSPVPPAMIERLDRATQEVIAASATGPDLTGGVEFTAEPVDFGPVEERLKKLEGFAEELSNDLPERLEKLEAFMDDSRDPEQNQDEGQA